MILNLIINIQLARILSLSDYLELQVLKCSSVKMFSLFEGFNIRKD